MLDFHDLSFYYVAFNHCDTDITWIFVTVTVLHFITFEKLYVMALTIMTYFHDLGVSNYITVENLCKSVCKYIDLHYRGCILHYP